MPLDPAFVKRHIKDWEENLTGPSYSFRNRWPHYLFHHAPLDNALQIIRDGQFRSRNDPGNLRAVDVAAREVVATRDDAHDRVRLYFRPRTPTQYHIEGIRRAGECEYGENTHCPLLVMFVLKADRVLTLPDVMFSDQNMQKANAHFYDDEVFFSSIPFEKVYHQGGINGDYSIIAHRCAEVMPASPLALKDNLRSILFRSDPERDTFLHFLGLEADTWSDFCRVSDALKAFEKNYSFVQSISLSSNGVQFALNPRSDAGKAKIRIQVTDSAGIVVFDFKHSGIAARPVNVSNWIARKDFLSGTYTLRVEIEGQLAYQALHTLGNSIF